eukprot:s187_g21.t1
MKKEINHCACPAHRKGAGTVGTSCRTLGHNELGATLRGFEEDEPAQMIPLSSSSCPLPKRRHPEDGACHGEYKYYSKLGLPYISIFTVFKIIAAAVALAVMLFGLIKALIKAIKELLKTMKKVIKVAGSGEFLPDIPGLPKIPKLKLPSVPGLPSPPKLSLGSGLWMAFPLYGMLVPWTACLSFSPVMAPLAILAETWLVSLFTGAIALLSKYRIFKARLWPPLSGLPGLRNGLYRLPYRGFKGVFSHLPYFDQLYNAGAPDCFLGIAGLPTVARNPGDQPMSASVPRPKIEGSGAPYYDLVMSDWQYTHGVVLGKSVLIPSIILNLSMRFKQFKEMVPLMGPPSVKEMFGMESFVQKIMRSCCRWCCLSSFLGDRGCLPLAPRPSRVPARGCLQLASHRGWLLRDQLCSARSTIRAGAAQTETSGYRGADECTPRSNDHFRRSKMIQISCFHAMCSRHLPQ